MAKKKAKAGGGRAKIRRKKATRKAAKAKVARKKVTRKKATAKKAVRRAAKVTKKKATRKPARPAGVKRAAKAPRKPAARVPAARPRPPRRTKAALPPEPRPIVPPVVDVEPLAPPPVFPTPPAPEAGPTGTEAGDEESGPTASLGGPVQAGPKTGDFAPDFALPDERAQTHTLSQYRGQRIVLYFYPKDDTPGCTTEACGFRDRLGSFTDCNAIVLGVSPDSVASHQRFVQKYGLNFPLLADEGHRVAEQYGVWVEKKRYGATSMGIARTTFVIGPDGRIEHVFRNVRPDGHEQEVLQRLGS